MTFGMSFPVTQDRYRDEQKSERSTVNSVTWFQCVRIVLSLMHEKGEGRMNVLDSDLIRDAEGGARDQQLVMKK